MAIDKIIAALRGDDGKAELAAWQVLGVAIRSEIDAVAFYTRLQGLVKNVILYSVEDFHFGEDLFHVGP